ncbi:rRNA maturation RNase YbeY [Candidatus Falkowbacteria bacterium]|nr:rRNA maturation RNase YbeY [Candidatus Falkowbacteria bacterium]
MVEFNNKVKAGVSQGWVKSVVARILRELKKKGDVSIALVGDKEITELNKKYRKRDEATDVLSFRESDGSEMVMPKKEEKFLGEVIIGYGQVKRQSREQGCSMRLEMIVLLVHGILHLLGYDHEKGEREAKIMQGEEQKLLNLFK